METTSPTKHLKKNEKQMGVVNKHPQHSQFLEYNMIKGKFEEDKKLI